MGEILCEMYKFLDIYFCTASIFNICSIALDRYWKIKHDRDYVNAPIFNRSRVVKSMLVMGKKKEIRAHGGLPNGIIMWSIWVTGTSFQKPHVFGNKSISVK